MVKESRHPIDSRRNLSSKNRVVISDVERMGYIIETGGVMDKELWRLGPDGPGEKERSPALDGGKGKSPALDRENMRGEPWLERTERRALRRLEWKGRKDDERRWR
ncbi:hypothetical protein TNCV_1111691 [Trichonephila clavipes]|nr:hypothetical protein TNCV_1111691 [Trichonephila clavipes]